VVRAAELETPAQVVVYLGDARANVCQRQVHAGDARVQAFGVRWPYRREVAENHDGDAVGALRFALADDVPGALPPSRGSWAKYVSSSGNGCGAAAAAAPGVAAMPRASRRSFTFRTRPASMGPLRRWLVGIEGTDDETNVQAVIDVRVNSASWYALASTMGRPCCAAARTRHRRSVGPDSLHGPGVRSAACIPPTFGRHRCAPSRPSSRRHRAPSSWLQQARQGSGVRARVVPEAAPAGGARRAWHRAARAASRRARPATRPASRAGP
jgi:hypothetical protein